MARFVAEDYRLRENGGSVHDSRTFFARDVDHQVTAHGTMRQRRTRQTSSLDCHPDVHSSGHASPVLSRSEPPFRSSTDRLDADVYPPRTSSLHHSTQLRHSRVSSIRRVSLRAATTHVPETQSHHSQRTSTSSSSTPQDSCISPITNLTISQFRQGIYPILYVVAAKMYHVKVWRQAGNGSRDLLDVKPPTIEQAARMAEEIGWNLNWEGWKWN